MKENEKITNRRITRKQLIVLDCIEQYIAEYGYSPSYREIGELIGSPTASVFQICLRLQEKGYISTANGKQRTIRVLVSCDDVYN